MMVSMLVYNFLAILMCTTHCWGTNTRMICEEIVTNSSQSHDTTHRIIRGKPGEKGETGQTGPAGPPGPPGSVNEGALVDLQRVIADGAITTADMLGTITRRLALLEESYVRRDLLELCDFIYADKCFFLLMHEVNTPVSPRCRASEGVNKPEAAAACARYGGHLANIYGGVHFQKVISLMRARTLIAHDYNHVWTGMTLDVQARRIRTSNGNWAPYQKWYPGRPYTPARKEIGIHTNYETESRSTGMFDEDQTCRILGGLCEKALI